MPDPKPAQKAQSRKLNIAHFIGSLHIGGAENQVVLLVNALNPEQFGRHVIVMHDEDTGFRGALANGVNYFSINYRMRNAPAAMYRLRSYLVENKIDILHCHMYHATVKGSLAGYLASVPVIVTSEHGKNTWKRWRHHAAEKYIVNRLIDKRIAVSEDIRQLRILQDGVRPEDIVVFPNCVDTDVLVKDNRTLPRIIGTLGRLVDAKDFPVLIRAVNSLKEEGRDVLLRIAGEGDQRRNLERLISEMRLDGVVELTGMQPAQEFLSSIDIFAMSSKREGVPVALLEAMACGLPIAATAVGGIPETLQDGVEGLLSAKGDCAALAANIGKLIDDMPRRVALGEAARDKVVRCYGTAGVVNKWTELYIRLLSAKRSR